MHLVEGEIFVSVDLDGVCFKAPPPLRTLLRLIRKNFSLPPEDRSLIPYTAPENWIQSLSSQWSVFFHRIRPANQEALIGLERFRQIALDNQRTIRFIALSGREPDKHPLTQRALEKAGFMDYFEDLLLNQGNSAGAWKEWVIRNAIKKGVSVIHIDDDLRTGLCLARVDQQKVMVYILKNLSNHSWLLDRNRIQIPENLLLVESFYQAARDFTQRFC